MTGLLFVTSQSTDVRDLNRMLLFLRDWDLASSSTTTTNTSLSPFSKSDEALVSTTANPEFIDHFRFVTTHKTTPFLASKSDQHSQTHGTAAPVPPSATFVNSWVGRTVEEIEEFMDQLSTETHAKSCNIVETISRRDSGYSTDFDSSSSLNRGYNTGAYLIVDSTGLETGTAIIGCRKSSNTWSRVRGIPWSEVCSAWKILEKNKSVEGLSLAARRASEISTEEHSSWYTYLVRPTMQQGGAAVVSSCRQRDLEVGKWHECGLV